MDASETAYAEALQRDGWRTKSSQQINDQKKPEVDIIAYNPQTKKMFYANLTYLSHNDEKNPIL